MLEGGTLDPLELKGPIGSDFEFFGDENLKGMDFGLRIVHVLQFTSLHGNLLRLVGDLLSIQPILSLTYP